MPVREAARIRVSTHGLRWTEAHLAVLVLLQSQVARGRARRYNAVRTLSRKEVHHDKSPPALPPVPLHLASVVCRLRDHVRARARRAGGPGCGGARAQARGAARDGGWTCDGGLAAPARAALGGNDGIDGGIDPATALSLESFPPALASALNVRSGPFPGAGRRIEGLRGIRSRDAGAVSAPQGYAIGSAPSESRGGQCGRA